MIIYDWIVCLTLIQFLIIYLGFCGAAFVMIVGRMAYEDIFVGPHQKFGYNYKSVFSWALVVFVSFPVVNIITVMFGIYFMIRDAIKGKNNAKPV